jgi:hypothetical protein
MGLLEEFALLHPQDVERRGGGTYVAAEVAGRLIDQAEARGIGVLGMEGFIIGKGTYPALSRIADFTRGGGDRRPDFAAWSCREARALLSGSWKKPPVGPEDQIHAEARGRYMVDITLRESD